MKIFREWSWITGRKKEIEKANNKSFKELENSSQKNVWNIYGWDTIGKSFKGEAIVHV